MTVTAVAQPWAAGPALASFSCCHLTGRGLVQRRRSYTRFVHDKPDQGTAGHVLVSPAAGVRDEGSRAFNKGCGSKPRRQSITTTTDSAHSKLTPKICTALSGRQTVTSSLPSPLQYSPAKSKCQQMTPSGVSHVSQRGAPVPCEQPEMPRAGGRLAHATDFHTLLFPKLTPNK